MGHFTESASVHCSRLSAVVGLHALGFPWPNLFQIDSSRGCVQITAHEGISPACIPGVSRKFASWAQSPAGCYTDRVDRPNSPWFSPPSVLDGSRGAVLVDVVLRYCCGLIHPKAPSQSGPAPVPAACGEIHPHSEALLFRSPPRSHFRLLK